MFFILFFFLCAYTEKSEFIRTVCPKLMRHVTLDIRAFQSINFESFKYRLKPRSSNRTRFVINLDI